VAPVPRVEHEGTARSDEVLLARMRAGDDTALGLVYDQHGGMVHGLARRVTGDEQLAQEITQDVFVFLWEWPDRVDLSRGSLRSYLGVIAHRRAVDAVRRATVRGRAETAASRRPASEDGFDDEITQVHAQRWCRERLLAAMAELPAEQRAALTLAYFEGCTYRDVARQLGIPEGTAKSRLRLALARVRALVGDELEAAR
jgi:RNA polymerase sigma-70 factor (ECF subfamily)